MQTENSRPVPGENEWGNPIDLDERYAKKRFFGWSLEKAESFFAENPYSGSEELFYMPRAVFRFYFVSFKRSVYSKKHVGHERCGLYINIVYCLRKCVEKCIPEIADFIELGYFLLANSRHFQLDRDARMELRIAIREAKVAAVAPGSVS